MNRVVVASLGLVVACARPPCEQAPLDSWRRAPATVEDAVADGLVVIEYAGPEQTSRGFVLEAVCGPYAKVVRDDGFQGATAWFLDGELVAGSAFSEYGCEEYAIAPPCEAWCTVDLYCGFKECDSAPEYPACPVSR